jgi:hypothetical protein
MARQSYPFRSDAGDPDLDSERHRVALGGVGQRDLYGSGGWGGERGADAIDVFGEGARSRPGPRGYRRPDSGIFEEVCEVLLRAAEIDARGIDIEVRGGEVILSGVVPHRWMKLRAEALIDGVPGVLDIQNRLRVVH